MNITVGEHNRICVELTCEDMTKLDITYDELDYSNIETRRVLWTLLDEAKHRLGRNFSLSEKMLIEAVPSDDGGCSIYFTVDDSRGRTKQVLKSVKRKYVCSDENIDYVAMLCKTLKAKGGIQKSELYTDGKKYRLIVQPEIAVKFDVAATMCEFCNVEDDSVIFYTYEHWKKLASPDAVGVLSVLCRD